jgi:SNF2 family DNA or RNA helicase
MYSLLKHQQLGADKLELQHMLGRNYALWFSPGLGKTLTTLHTLNKLGIDKILIVAPMRVMYMVWPQEIEKWGFGFSHHIVHGAKKHFDMSKNINIINPEGLVWAYQQMQKDKSIRFHTLVIDESSMFKSRKSKRFKAIAAMPFEWVLQLTGTPAPNSLIDIWSQVYLLDRGESLGKSVTKYKEHYFDPDKRNGHVVYSWKLKPGAERDIYSKINHLILRLDLKDYLDLEPKITNKVYVKVPKSVISEQNKLKRRLLTELDLEPKNAAHIGNLCHQLANGSVYVGEDKNRRVEVLHTAKVDALKEIIEEAGDEGCLVAYNFRHDADAIRQAFPDAYFIDGSTSESVKRKAFEAWDKKEIRVLFANTKSLSHGLNLQGGGRHVVFYSLTWSLEAHEQFIGRLYRNGQDERVVIHYLLSAGTIDDTIYNRLMDKNKQQESLLDAIKSFAEEK